MYLSTFMRIYLNLKALFRAKRVPFARRWRLLLLKMSSVPAIFPNELRLQTAIRPPKKIGRRCSLPRSSAKGSIPKFSCSSHETTASAFFAENRLRIPDTKGSSSSDDSYRQTRKSIVNWSEILHKKLKSNGFSEAVYSPSLSSSFSDWSLRTKVEILYSTCELRLVYENVDQFMEGDAMRAHPIGEDSKNNTYWYFFGLQLYKEDSKKLEELINNRTIRPSKKIKRRCSSPRSSARGSIAKYSRHETTASAFFPENRLRIPDMKDSSSSDDSYRQTRKRYGDMTDVCWIPMTRNFSFSRRIHIRAAEGVESRWQRQPLARKIWKSAAHCQLGRVPPDERLRRHASTKPLAKLPPPSSLCQTYPPSLGQSTGSAAFAIAPAPHSTLTPRITSTLTT